MKLILCGCAGRMGAEVIDAAEQFPAEIVCGVDLSPKELPFPVYENVNSITEEADVFLDFSSPQGLEERIRFCVKRELPLLFAATGTNEKEEELLKEAAEKIPVMIAPNLSPAVCLLNALAKRAAEALPEKDVAIIEAHGKKKRDSPSGTARMLKETIEEVRKSGVPVESLRMGNLAGEHSVIFADENEVLTLSHSARNKKVFALGALRAARWLIDQPAGIYSAKDAFF